MAVGREGRSLIGPLLIANFVVYLILLGLAAWSLDKYIDGEQNHPHLGGNPATSFMLIFAMVGGVIGVCSVVAGLMHHRAWCSNSLVTAASSAIISWAVTSLALGLVCKEIIMGGYRGKRLQTLEAFIAISTLSQLLYLVLLHAGMFSSRYGPSYHSRDGTGTATTHDSPKTSAPVVI
ncbi:membrane protein PM19L-like isoform X1 [Actinidia eriantha]|uniref:membrane protein PM19L-like isoform X1 n=1 Tax=Actinidia eriantha TaxID=165200 RepID=UPI002583BA30|nr:membrane protein PM19L-like isoform X1 [Actinidia eriantha]